MGQSVPSKEAIEALKVSYPPGTLGSTLRPFPLWFLSFKVKRFKQKKRHTG